jgi:hypothetical protein
MRGPVLSRGPCTEAASDLGNGGNGRGVAALTRTDIRHLDLIGTAVAGLGCFVLKRAYELIARA